jgi:predicted NBD/HSP70 family sugar kinase
MMDEDSLHTFEISPMRHRRSTATTMEARVLELIASGQATTRTELARELAAPASTVSLAVGQLVDRGLVAEYGTQASTGGRPRKTLRLGGVDEFAIAADLGGRHARIGAVLPGGAVADVSTVAFDISSGPERALAALADALTAVADARGTGTLRGVGVALPGPVNVEEGKVDRPSRMPGWNGFPVASWLEERFGVTAAVDNDANCMALAELTVQPSDRRQFIMVKAGSAIGAGIVVDGHLYRGATGAAGDITHVRIDAAGDAPCSCGNTGCLETLASGAALVGTLQSQGLALESSEDVARLVSEGDPRATQAVRRAGKYLGEVLSANVNFFNPDAVYLGGILSTLDPFVAAVRSQLYEGCHPLVTEHLTIARASLGADAGMIGAGVSALGFALTRALQSANSSASNAVRDHAGIR